MGLGSMDNRLFLSKAQLMVFRKSVKFPRMVSRLFVMISEVPNTTSRPPGISIPRSDEILRSDTTAMLTGPFKSTPSIFDPGKIVRPSWIGNHLQLALRTVCHPMVHRCPPVRVAKVLPRPIHCFLPRIRLSGVQNQSAGSRGLHQ
jgi:hypothetical protein